MPRKITASFKFHGQDNTAEVINPGDCDGKTWLVFIEDCFDPPLFIVEADSASDAEDIFLESEYGHMADVDDPDEDDYPEDERHYGPRGKVVDTSSIMIYGDEADGCAFPCRYHGTGLPEGGIKPTAFGDWPYASDGDTFAVDEYISGFEVRHIPSGATHWMSDGVDVIFDEDEDGNDVPVYPGTDGFCERWATMLNETADETMEAYFPEFLKDED